MADIDVDGNLDLLALDAPQTEAGEQSRSQMLLNTGDGAFEALDNAAIGLGSLAEAKQWGAVLSDFDNDGDPDVITVGGGYQGLGHIRYFENRLESGELTFTEATQARGLPPYLSSWWGITAADFDSDGWLDVVITRTDGPPQLFMNEGGRRFADRSEDLGLTSDAEAISPLADWKNPVVLDADSDGDDDVFLAGVNVTRLLLNEGSGVFSNTSDRLPPVTRLPTNQISDGFSEVPYFFSTADFCATFDRSPTESPIYFAAAAADLNADGLEDIYVGRYNKGDVALLQQSDGTFGVEEVPAGPPAANNTMGLGVDPTAQPGRFAVYIGTGNPKDSFVDSGLCQSADGLTNGECGPTFTKSTRGHGAAFGDLDNNGTNDLVLNPGGVGGTPGHLESMSSFVRLDDQPMAKIRLIGTLSNADAIGARVEFPDLRSGVVVIRSAQGFQSQNSRDISVPMGARTQATARISWPSGQKQDVVLHAGKLVTVIERDRTERR